MDKDTGLLDGGHVYFAHPMSDYGSAWEGQVMTMLRDGFREYNIINPGEARYEPGWQKKGMKYFDEDLLPLVDILVFAGFPNAPRGINRISSGVAYEIDAFNTAKQDTQGARLYEIDRRERTIHAVDPWSLYPRYMDRFETRVMLRKYNKKYR